MKKFLIQFGIWLGIALILSITTDVMISSGLRKTDIRKYAVWNDIYKGGLHPDLIIIGSSRAWCGYNTYILDSVLGCDSYNLGLDGHQIDFQTLRFNTFQRFNALPKLVVINVDFTSTFDISAESQYEREQFFPYFQDRLLISQVAKAKKITWADRYLPLVRYFGYRDEFETGIASFFGKTDFADGGMHKGYRGNEYGWERGPTLSSDTLIYVSVNEEAITIFDSFAKQLSDEGVKVVFVKSPVYLPLLEKFIGIGLTDSIFNTIAKNYSIPVLDYYNSDISVDSTNFYNPGHLNKKGSELFTFELCHDLDSLGLLK